VERQPLKKLTPDENGLLKLLELSLCGSGRRNGCPGRTKKLKDEKEGPLDIDVYVVVRGEHGCQ
jgi:hypothetical protein